jgi:hypothetical protein
MFISFKLTVFCNITIDHEKKANSWHKSSSTSVSYFKGFIHKNGIYKEIDIFLLKIIHEVVRGILTLLLLNHRQHLMRKARNFYCRQKTHSS